jgi:hypothetical protein
MNSFMKSPELAKYFRPKVAVVKVAPGETQEEAWRRHLLSHPESATADIKIFHSLKPGSPKPGGKAGKVLQFK